VKLHRGDDAKQAYRKYLELAPNGSSATYARQKLNEMGAAAE
jgi:predicted RNA polymerase sigma factor